MNSIQIGCASSLALALLASAGCKETTSSCNIRTPGIAMSTHVVARSESDVRVETTLQVGGDESNTYIILDDCDRMFAVANGDSKEMRAISDGVYEAKFGVGAEGTEYRVVLERDQDETADANSGALPTPFGITSNFGDAPISREDDLEITWDPAESGDDMGIDIDDEAAGCIYSFSQNIGGDPGSYTVMGGELESTSSLEPETCDVKVTLSRSRDGTHDRSLDSESSFVLMQVRSAGFASAP
jgi:hypothetical protein